MTKQYHYGSHPEQVIDLYGDPAPKQLIVLIHGGYWRAHIDRTYFAAVAEHLASRRRCAVANVEYRRSQAGAWPTPLDDVRLALRWLDRHCPGAQTGLIGHSVGGQLALLASRPSDRVLALAPVTDVQRIYDERLGDDAAREYFGHEPSRELLELASPLHAALAYESLLVVHGASDDRVPVEHSRDFIDYQQGQGNQRARLKVIDAGHFDFIDPSHTIWGQVPGWISASS